MNVGAGWQEILAALHRQLTDLLGDYEILQIKEKFGGLRYYFRVPEGTDENTRRAAYVFEEEAEAKSFTICEVCGKPGTCTTTPGGFWLKTLCDLHRGEDAERIAAGNAQFITDEEEVSG